jgi:hypothetical protein
MAAWNSSSALQQLLLGGQVERGVKDFSGSLEECVQGGVVEEMVSLEKKKKKKQQQQGQVAVRMMMEEEEEEDGRRSSFPGPPTNPMVTALLTDMYQITMAYAYWKADKHNDRAV